MRERFTQIGKIYVWSIVIEPLLFFVFADNTAFGVTPNPGRLLQFVVWFGLIATWVTTTARWRIPNPISGLYANYTMYFAVTAIAGVAGMMMGSYVLQNEYQADLASSAMASIIRSPAIRPLFEYFIAIYYFTYFVVMPRYLLNSEAGIRYFFRIFKAVFVVGTIVGMIDLFLVPFGIEWIPRHLSDGVHVGFRFHGLAGEPRDAFVYLMFCLATLSLYEYWTKGRALGRFWTLVIFAAVLLTQSASGLFGLAFAGLLILFFSVRSLSRRTLMLAGVLAVVLMGTIFAGIYFSPRIQSYLKALSALFEILDRRQQLPPIMVGQMSNIYPLWDMYQKLKDGNYVQLIIGSGLGSSSVATNNLGLFRELANPHTQVVRVLYESGFVGLYFMIMSFVAPVRRLTINLPPDVRRRFLFLTLMLVGVFLSHRSSVPFIFLGIFIVVMQRSIVHADKPAEAQASIVATPLGAAI